MNATKPKFQTCFTLQEFQQRRRRVADAIGDGVAVIQGLPDSGAKNRFRQHNDFFYLCGVEVANAYLLIDGKTSETTLYLLPSDPHVSEEEGISLSCDDPGLAIELTGVDHVKPIDSLENDLVSDNEIFTCHLGAEGRQVCQDSINAALRRHQQDPWVDTQTTQSLFVQSIKRRCGASKFQDLSPTIRRLRGTKSEEEISVMQKAGKLASLATAEAMRCTTDGLQESQLAGVADYIFLINGAIGGGYRPIVASGNNIWNLHYSRNDSRLTNGDLVLFDYAPDVCNYTSDIGRMWPVSGKYLPWQRELYSLVVDYHLALLDLTKPGMTPAEVRKEALRVMKPAVSRTKWSKASFADAADKLLATSRAMTHSVGMAVHDESGYQDDDVALEPGLVFALDPQLWVPEERLYFRVEDCVVVSDGGLENFTDSVPHQPDDIERLMKSPGILQDRADLLI